ncbi:MAG: hypothetical protein IPK83_07545 [Planctomycetes bacterium]|nr:hypothetical protein [Planctomycetota bacterium]
MNHSFIMKSIRHCTAVCIVMAAAAPLAADPIVPLPTNIQNFYMRGTQQLGLEPGNDIIISTNQCSGCHGQDAPIFEEWSGSLMAQAARDPVFYACLDIAERDAPGSGDTCIRCHVPKAWLEGRSVPTNGAAITRDDRDGITCHFCHRLVDPFDPTYAATPLDEIILFGLGNDRPVQSFDLGNPPSPGFGGSANYVIDPFDRRRGPFPLVEDGIPSPPAVTCDTSFHYVFTFGQCEDDLGLPDGCPTFQSPFHLKSNLCATCHDVSFPHVSYNAQGQAVFNGTGVRHPDGNKYNMAAEQRTYSEWLKSSFSQPGGVDLGGRFGAPGQNSVSSCQDCHMAGHLDQGCEFVQGERPDIPRHDFRGASTWVLEAIALQFGPDGPIEGFPISDGLGPEFFQDRVDAILANVAKNEEFHQLAADLEVSLDDEHAPGEVRLKVRVVNQTGHKLPTGYIEGRRMFLTVEYFDCSDSEEPFVVFGGYDKSTATLDSASTKVYHAEIGPDENVAALVNLSAAPSQHSAFGTKMYYDNRIPPRGFTNANFQAIQAAPVGYTYADGQHWDDTFFEIPSGAAGAKVTLYYQQTSREYIEFLRDNNPNAQSDPTNRGALAYALWEQTGKSNPVLMAQVGGDGQPYDIFGVSMTGDTNCDLVVDVNDIPRFVDALLGLTTQPFVLRAADLDGLDGPDGKDIQLFVNRLLEG